MLIETVFSFSQQIYHCLLLLIKVMRYLRAPLVIEMVIRCDWWQVAPLGPNWCSNLIPVISFVLESSCQCVLLHLPFFIQISLFSDINTPHCWYFTIWYFETSGADSKFYHPWPLEMFLYYYRVWCEALFSSLSVSVYKLDY